MYQQDLQQQNFFLLTKYFSFGMFLFSSFVSSRAAASPIFSLGSSSVYQMVPKWPQIHKKDLYFIFYTQWSLIEPRFIFYTQWSRNDPRFTKRFISYILHAMVPEWPKIHKMIYIWYFIPRLTQDSQKKIYILYRISNCPKMTTIYKKNYILYWLQNDQIFTRKIYILYFIPNSPKMTQDSQKKFTFTFCFIHQNIRQQTCKECYFI